jgi:general secretion pathway protein D
MLIASIAQNRQTDGRQGLPLVGLVPILGRLFTTPTKNNSQSDIVITMTPRVLRAPEILPEDELSHPTGSMQNPQSESLEAMIRDADREDQFARLRSLPTNQAVQLPPQPGEDVSYVPAPKALADAANGGAQAAPTTTTADVTNNNAGAKPVNVSIETSGAAQPVASPAVITANTPTNAAAKPNVTAAEGPRVEPSAGDPPAPAVKSASAPNNNASAPTANNNVSAPTTNNAGASPTNNAGATAVASASPNAGAGASAASTAELLVLPEGQELKVGERRRVMVLLKTDAPVGLATATLRFDPRALAVRSVSSASLAADKSGAPVVTQSVDPKGVLVFSVSPAAGAQPLTGEGLLLFIEVEGLAAGDGSLQFDADKVHLIATDGRNVVARARGGSLKVTQ